LVSFPRFLFRRLLIGAAALHLAEQPFALKLLLQHLKGLVDIVVAYENLQRKSPFLKRHDRASAAQGGGPHPNAAISRKRSSRQRGTARQLPNISHLGRMTLD